MLVDGKSAKKIDLFCENLVYRKAEVHGPVNLILKKILQVFEILLLPIVMPNTAVAIKLEENIADRTSMDTSLFAVDKTCMWAPNLMENFSSICGDYSKIHQPS